MRNKKILQIVSLMLCLTVAPSITVFAGEGELKAYTDTEYVDDPYVNDIDEYLTQLNAGLITPANTTIITYESAIVPFGLVLDPSKSCSNLFGHSWTDWGSWSEVRTDHYDSGTCHVTIERWRFCTRTYCGASQKEIDGVWVSCNH